MSIPSFSCSCWDFKLKFSATEPFLSLPKNEILEVKNIKAICSQGFMVEEDKNGVWEGLMSSAKSAPELRHFA